jgi:peroxiredoxin
MGKVATTWAIAAVVCAVAVGGHLAAGVGAWVPIAGTVVTTLATFVAWGKVIELNVPRARVGGAIAMAANGGMVFSASGSWQLAVACSLPLMLAMPGELIMRNNVTLLNWQNLFAAAVGVVFLVLAWPTGWWGLAALPAVGATLSLAVYLLANHGKGVAARERAKLTVGSPIAVDVKLPARDDAAPFDLADHADSFALLVFIRGDWCPVCHVMMRIISREADMLNKHHVKVAIISPTEGQMEDEAVEKLGLNPGMLFDEDSKLAASLGLIESKKDGKDVPVAVSILVGPGRVVRHISRPDDVTSFSSERKVVSILEAAAA